MKVATHTIPKTGEIRYAYVERTEDTERKHKYIGKHRIS